MVGERGGDKRLPKEKGIIDKKCINNLSRGTGFAW
jgi:hypothetical protein